MKDEVTDALLAAAYEWWRKPGSALKRTSWTTEDAVALMAGGPAAENKGGLSVCMPSSFPEDVEPPPQSVADVECSQYTAALHDFENGVRRSRNDRFIRSRDTATRKGGNL